MSASSPDTGEQQERPITFHYILVVVVEIVTIAALASLAAAFR